MGTGLSAVVAAVLTATAVGLWSANPARAGLPPAGAERRDRRPGDTPGPRWTVRASPADSRAGPDRHDLLRLAGSAAVGLAVWAFVPGGWGLTAAIVATAVAWRQSRSWEPASARRRRLRMEGELPWVVDLLTAALRAGLGPAEALSRVVEVSHPDVREALQVPLARLRLGADPVAVWTELATDGELGRLGVALRRATESGAPVVDALARLGEDLRASRRAAVEVRVRRIEVQAALPLGVCLLPAFVLLAVVPLVAGSASRLLAP